MQLQECQLSADKAMSDVIPSKQRDNINILHNLSPFTSMMSIHSAQYLFPGHTKKNKNITNHPFHWYMQFFWALNWKAAR